jgi:hypothetical protein
MKCHMKKEVSLPHPTRFLPIFYSFYLVLQILGNDFYIYIDLDLYPNSNIYTI